MRVLHLVRSLGVGGLERVVVGLTDGLAAEGIECYLGCLLERGKWADRASVVDTWVGGLTARGRLGVVRDLSRYVKGNGVQLIHSHNPEPHLIGAAASLLSRTPLVHTKHGRNYPDDPRRVWLNRQLARVTRRVVAVSEDAAKVAREIEMIPAAKVVVIRNGIAVADGVSAAEGGSGDSRNELGIAEDAFVVGSVGRFSPEKNYGLLVRAFRRFFESVLRDVRLPVLLLVGDGPERPALEKLVAELGLENSVLMPGTRDDVQPCLAAMDVFCLSSTTEGTSITLLEAGAAGLPAIVTAVGGNGEVVSDGNTGIVVPSGGEEAMAHGLERIFRERERREKLGTNARKRIAEKYSLDMMVAGYMGIYSEVTGGQ